MRLKDHLGQDSHFSDARIKKSSYYVWFLGSEECRGLRGTEVVRPVLQYLLEKEREFEPEKVTLQVSSKGIKLLSQGLIPKNTSQGLTSKNTSRGNIKLVIPSGALTYVQQYNSPDDDIVAAVVLIYDPNKRCPVHLHAYRCDSTETAGLLRQHLSQLVAKPDQQAKVTALESRLISKGVLLHGIGSRSSDGGSTGSSSPSSSGGTASPEKIASLYDSLAAELREKLGRKSSPVLLPSKDYPEQSNRRRRIKKSDEDSLRRRHSGPGVKHIDEESAKSSGIGSDDAPSPVQESSAFTSPQQSAEYNTDRMTKESHLGAEQFYRKNIRNSFSVNTEPEAFTGIATQYQSPVIHQQKQRRYHSPTRRSTSPTKITAPTQKLLARRESRKHKERSASPSKFHDRYQDARDKFVSLEGKRNSVDLTPLSSYNDQQLNRSISMEEYTSKNYSNRSRDRRSKVFGNAENVSFSKAIENIEITPMEEYVSKNYSNRSRDRRSKVYSEELGCLKTPNKIESGSYGHRGVRVERRGSHRDYVNFRIPDRVNTRNEDIQIERTRWSNSQEIGQYPGQEPTDQPMDLRRQRSSTRNHRKNLSPEKQDYTRAKSMHDLSHHNKRSAIQEDRKSRDHRRRSLYDPSDDPSRDKKRYFSSNPQLGYSPMNSPCLPSSNKERYIEIPEHKRYPGLDRATARNPLNPLAQNQVQGHLPSNSVHQEREPRSFEFGDHRQNRRTYDYPVNGGYAPIQINRPYEDYRKFRYEGYTQ